MGSNTVGFYGQYSSTLDDKGRCSLPARLRSIKGPDGKALLEGDIVLTKGLEGCLSLYAASEWEDIQARFAGLNFTQKDFRFFSRKFYSTAGLVTPDKAGRILIPSTLIKEARLKRELLILGVNRWIEIWDPERYEYYLEQFSGSYEEVAERLFSGDEREPE